MDKGITVVCCLLVCSIAVVGSAENLQSKFVS
jgi:hypothetical protein